MTRSATNAALSGQPNFYPVNASLRLVKEGFFVREGEAIIPRLKLSPQCSECRLLD